MEFSVNYHDSGKPLNIWYKIISRQKFLSFAELRKVFSSADIIDKFTVFNIGGNKFRLIAAIHYNTQIVYIRHILTHKEYDQNKWRE